MKTCVFFADRHLIHDEQPHWSWTLFKEFLRDFKPDILVDGGDHLDLPYISSFNKDKLLLLEGKRLKKDFDLLNEELAELKGLTGERFLFLQGNHEERLERAVQKQPLLEGMVDLEANADFESLGIEYYPLNKQPVKIGKLHFMHGTRTGKYSANQHLMQYMGNVVFGHVHRFQSHYHGIPLRNDEMGANAVGCLCGKWPEWAKSPMHWQNGFAVIYFDEKGYFNFYPVIMTKKRFIFNGRVYE